ncbi:MAG: glycosyltransferase [Ruminococcus sp.]|nr:glycosyltransferase [Ruminococcus sp.]
MKQLKIGLFNESFPPTIDGVSNTVVNYARIIHEKYGESVVVTPRYKNVVDDYPFKVIRYTSLPTEKTRIRYRAGIPFSVPSIRQIQKENLDLIHVHSPFTAALLARNVNIGHRLPVVMTYHTKFASEFEFTLKKKALCKVAAEFVTSNFNYADEVWTVSKGAADSLRELGYTGPSRVMVNGADITLDPVSPEIMRRVQAETAIASNELVFMYCGRMQWYKNIRLIIDALVKVKAAGVRFKMIFVGGGPEREEMIDYTRKVGLFTSTMFPGPIHDRALLKGYFTRADLFLVPSTYDTAGLVVMEAAACRTPSVLIKNSCASEIVTDGRNGFISEENADAFSAAILNAIGDRSALAQIGERAADEVYLSWDDSVTNAYKRYEEIYDEWISFGRMRRKSVMKPDND